MGVSSVTPSGNPTFDLMGLLYFFDSNKLTTYDRSAFSVDDSKDKQQNRKIQFYKNLKFFDKKIQIFDKKFKIGSWTDYTEENFGVTNTGKKGYEYSAFLSTPLENSYKIKTATFSYSGIKYYTTIDGLNPNNYYSIDI